MVTSSDRPACTKPEVRKVLLFQAFSYYSYVSIECVVMLPLSIIQVPNTLLLWSYNFRDQLLY